MFLFPPISCSCRGCRVSHQLSVVFWFTRRAQVQESLIQCIVRMLCAYLVHISSHFSCHLSVSLQGPKDAFEAMRHFKNNVRAAFQMIDGCGSWFQKVRQVTCEKKKMFANVRNLVPCMPCMPRNQGLMAMVFCLCHMVMSLVLGCFRNVKEDIGSLGFFRIN